MAQQPGPSKRLCLQSSTTVQYASSGLKRSLHGVVYQFKLLMLFVHRAMKNGYKFNLATEMDAADKFDDVVLVYEENQQNVYRFLQAKHKQEECKQETKTINNKKTKIETPVKISTKELLRGPLDGEFYLPKYFMSYRKIMKNKKFNSVGNKVLDLILCTNIDLDCEELKDNGIKTEEIIQSDPIINVPKRNKQPKRYKLSVPDKSNEFYEKLRQTSDLNRLASELIACLENNDIATLRNKLFEQYHVALMKKVLEPSKTKAYCKFRKGFFVKNLKDQDALKFREAMKICLGITDDTKFKKQMENKQLHVSSTFVKIDNSDTQLGDDNVDDKEIEDFLDKLVLAVDQPNESELGRVINEEIGSEFNLIHPDFVTSNFQAEILDWLKTKDGFYLSSDTAEQFFEELRAKVFELVLIGPTAIFSSKLGSYAISYENGNATLKKIEDFLKSNIQVLYIKMTQPRLGSLKVNQMLTQNADFKKDDSFVLISSKFLLSMEKQLKAVFKADSKSLLVIECSETLRTEQFQLLHEILSNPLKKLIVVARESTRTKFSKSFDEVVDDASSFEYLTLESQNKVLKRKVIFQGVEIKLDGIVGAIPKIDADTLLQLLNDVTLTIGKDVKHHDFDPDYYIPRFYFRHVEIETTIEEDFTQRGFSDVISYDETTFENLQGNAHLFKKNHGTLIWKKSKGKITRLVPYKKKKPINSSKYIHWYGKNGCYEKNLIEEKVVVIADSAGMGKSHSLSSLALQLKQLDPSLWVVRIDLNDYTKVFQNRFDTFEQIIFFLADDVLNLHGFGAELFKTRLVEKNKIVFLLDGFDEISPNYKDVVLQMTETLLEYSTKIFVTSRLSTSDAVEEKIGVFSHRIRPFSKDEQNEFLCKHWSGNTGIPSERCTTYVNAIIEKLSESISDREREFTGIPLQMRMVRDIFRRSETGKWQGYTDFITSNEEQPHLPPKLDLMFLYEKFFWEKFSVISMEKKRDDLSKVGVREDNETLFRNLVVEHQSAALYSMLDEEVVKKLLSRKEISKMRKFLKEVEEEKKNRGIIDLIIDNKPRFVHRTFVEYLIADFFFTALLFDCSDEIFEFVFCHILLRREYGVIRRFMDNMFLKLLNNSDADFSNVFTLKNDYDDKVIDIFEEARAELHSKIAKMWENHRELCIGDRNTTVFHVLIEEENFNLLKFFIECMNNDTITTMADVRRDMDDGSLLYMLASKQNSKLMEYVLNKGVCVDSIGKTGKTVLSLAIRECFQPSVIETLIKFGAKLNNIGDDGQYDIHAAAEKGNVEVVNAMLKANCVVNVTDDYQITALHYAVYSGNVVVVQLIGSKVDEFDARDENGNTALHYAAYSGNLEMCKWLSERIDVELRANDGSCILHEAAISGNLDLFKFLVEEKKLDVGIVDHAKRTPLHEAAKYDNIDIVKYIIEEKSFDCFGIIDENGHTPFHEAAKYGSEELLNYFFDKGMKIDAEDNYGKTLFHIAAQYGNVEAVKWLSTQNGIDANSKDKSGCTVLQNAFNDVDGKKWELERNSKVQRKVYPDGIERTESWTHVPVDDLTMIIRILVENCGVDINEETSSGGTVLHSAVTDADVFVVDALIKNGANSSIRDATGKSAFELAWDNTFVEKLQLMVNTDNITSKNQDGKGLLHWAVEKDDFDFLSKLVLVVDVDFSLLDDNGKTALDLANDLERLECQEILKYHQLSDDQIDDQIDNN